MSSPTSALSSNTLAVEANAQLGIGLPLMYGRCRVRGDNIMLYQDPNTKWTVAFYILGEGEWDGIEALWVNKKLVNPILTSTPGVTAVHFHPGQDGVLGSGLTPTSSGGDNLVDSMFNALPANFARVTYSRKAYLAINTPPDPQAPNANLDVIADYRCMKVRIFDSSGNQTAYQFSTNGAWQVLDLILRKILNPEYTTAGAAASGGDLSAAQKARIDFPSVVSAAAWCDAVLANGQKRFESNVAIVQTQKLNQALTQLLTMSQLYVTEEAGKIYILPDQARSSTFLLTSDHVVAGTASFDKIDLHGAANRIFASFNDTNPMDQADIAAPASNGLVRSSNVVTVTTLLAHPFVVNDNAQICPPTDGSTHDTSFDGIFPVVSVPSTTSFTYAQTGSNATSGNGFVGTPESRFSPRSTNADHQRMQKAIGQRGLNLNAVTRRLPLNLDLGNNTMERALRILNFLKNRNLGVDTDPWVAPWKGKLTAFLDAVDTSLGAGSYRALIAQLAGDIITIDRTISEQYAGDYEIMKKTINLPAVDQAPSNSVSAAHTVNTGGAGSGVPTIDLELLQYLPAAFSDGTYVMQALASGPNRGSLALSIITDNLIRNGDFSLGSANWTDASGSFSLWQFLLGQSGLPRGSAELKITLNSGQTAQPLSSEKIPIDFTKTYLMEVWVKISGSGSAVWAGLAEYDRNGNIFNHLPSGGFRAWGVLDGIGNTTGWQYFAAEFNGNGGTSPGTNQFNSSAAFASVVLFSQPTGTSTLEICMVRFSEVAAGAGRAVSGLKTSGQLQSSFKNNTLNANGHFTGANPLSQSGTTTTINIAAFTVQFGAGQISYNSGSVNPGSYGSWFIYFDDPTFAGGTVTFQATQTASVLTAADGRVWIGTITTASGGGGSGSGGGGGHQYP